MRLVTRSDFDGLVCAVLLTQVEQIDEIKFVHPKDLQDGNFEVRPDDVLTNVPYVPGCGLWFDHHSTEVERVVDTVDFKGECRVAPSAARVIYDYYGGLETFGEIDELMTAVDKADSADFTAEEILNPKNWDLLSFLMDARTGLGRYNDYRISNYQLMYDLVEACRRLSIQEILALPDVQERVKRYFEQEAAFRGVLKERTTIHGSVIVTDMRDVEHDPLRQPVHGLRAEPRAEPVRVDRQRIPQPELRLRLRAQHRQSSREHGYRRADAPFRRRRPPRGRHLPGSARGRGADASGHCQRDERRRRAFGEGGLRAKRWKRPADLQVMLRIGRGRGMNCRLSWKDLPARVRGLQWFSDPGRGILPSEAGIHHLMRPRSLLRGARPA